MPTLAQTETVLVGPAPDAGAGLVGAVLARVGFSAIGESPVAALAPAIGTGLAACGIVPDDVIAPDDDDMARLPNTDWPKFLDITSLLLLESALIVSVGGLKSIQFEDYQKELFGSADLTAVIETRRDEVRRRWGYGASRMFAGSFQIKSDANSCEF